MNLLSTCRGIASQTKQRYRRLIRQFTRSPTLPILGWTKATEVHIDAGGLFAHRHTSSLEDWLVYATIVTLLWGASEILAQIAEEASE